MKVTVTPDAKAARRFHEAMQQIRKISGRDFETVMKHELGYMLATAVKGTKNATIKSITKNHDQQPGGMYRIAYAGPETRTGKTYSEAQIRRAQARAAKARESGGAALYYLKGSNQPHRYPNWLWNELKVIRQKSLQNKKQARGLAAKMWVHIGNQLGIPAEAPGYVKNAKHHKAGDMAGAVQTRVRGSGKSFEIAFINALTKTNPWARAGQAWRKALNGRANYFSRAVKLEAGGQIKRVLDRYPGLASMS